MTTAQKSITTTTVSESGTQLLINACKKQRADGYVKSRYADKLPEFVGMVEKRGDGDYIYEYQLAVAAEEEADGAAEVSELTYIADEAVAETETPETVIETENAETDEEVETETTDEAAAEVNEEAVAPIETTEEDESEDAENTDDAPQTETPEEAPPTAAAKLKIEDDISRLSVAERKAYKTDEDASELNAICTRQITADCQANGGAFTPKAWKVRQNYRVCNGCQNVLNKPYRQQKAETATA